MVILQLGTENVTSLSGADIKKLKQPRRQREGKRHFKVTSQSVKLLCDYANSFSLICLIWPNDPGAEFLDGVTFQGEKRKFTVVRARSRQNFEFRHLTMKSAQNDSEWCQKVSRTCSHCFLYKAFFFRRSR